MKRITFVPLGIFFLTILVISSWAESGNAFDPVNKSFFGVAIKGYDTVTYWTEGRAMKGKRKFSHNWNDAKWYFTNAGNRDLFASDPERYAPQYGGH